MKSTATTRRQQALHRSFTATCMLFWLMRFSLLASQERCAAFRSKSNACRRILATSSSPPCWGYSSSLERIQHLTTSSTGFPLVNQRQPFNPFSSSSLSLSTTSSSPFSSTDPSQDTIFALSSGYTGRQATAVAIIRISGPHAHDVLKELLQPPSATKPRKLPKARTAALCKLYCPKQGHMLDHALVLRFDQPNSFTGEDCVELQCHGSRAVVQGVLDVLANLSLSKGEGKDTATTSARSCRLADPGEFTQRAFGNGKLDLVQVEALADVLGADTQAQLQQALGQLDGRLSEVYDSWRKQLISGLAHAEAVIDFGDDERLGDEDDEDDDDDLQQQWDIWGNVGHDMLDLQQSMELHLQDDRKGELLREGVKIAIVGPPNAGKSSLFNLLARQEAAIVSPIAGTTRDVLQVSMDLGGVKCTLQDTAGVRTNTSDVLELEGIKRAQAVATKADLVVGLVDGTESSSADGIDIVQQVLMDKHLESKHVMLVMNKLDLMDSSSELKTTGDLNGFGGTYKVSCVTQEGIGEFLDALTESVLDRTKKSSDEAGEGSALITRARHRQHVEAAAEALSRFAVLSQQGSMVVDMAAEELRLAASELGRITGAVDVEDVLDVLFSDFCIGK